jgi:glycine/D-amino acid oxidase-like deaminating enzyme
MTARRQARLKRLKGGFQVTYDVLIVGGGIMGSSTAFNLARLEPKLKTAVVEKDPTYAKSSTTLSAANLRTVAFSLKENFLISKRTFEILATFESDMSVEGRQPGIYFRAEGNLFLCNAKGLASARRIFDTHKSLGSNAEWFGPEEIKRRWPLYHMEGIAAGTFGPTDGHVDAYGLLMAYKTKARSLGVEYLQDEAVSLTVADRRVTGARLATGRELTAGVTVNCAGAWAGPLARTAGVEIPVVPVRRQIFAVDTQVKPERPLPLTFHPSGLYLRSESGGLILCGKSLDEDPVAFDFNWERERFMDVIWPELAAFIPAFESLRLVRGWAGLYEVNTLDHNAIIGPWPELEGFYLCNGFSGHGLMQGPAVGEHLAERLTGRHPTLDLSVFTPERILRNCPMGESGCF